MSKLHDFLVEHAKFPFPAHSEHLSAGTTDISQVDVGLLEPEWKARLAVRDETLAQKLCDALKKILADAPLPEHAKGHLLTNFSPLIQINALGSEDRNWSKNSSEADSRRLLDKGFFVAARNCLWVYDQSNFETETEHLAEEGKSKVDYVALVDNRQVGLCEVKSPSVMKKFCNELPQHGIELNWCSGRSLVSKILTEAALYLGLRKIQWLFLTCFNYWVVCRLVRDDENPYIVYSPMISIQESSEPFRAFLGAILSVTKDKTIESSAYDPDINLETIEEDQDPGPLPEDDDDDESGDCLGSLGSGAVTPPMTRSRYRNSHGNTESELLVTSSSPKLSENLQVWTRLYTTRNNSLAIPPSSGSTGTVWKCRFDTSHDSFAAKIVELLRPSDTQKRQRLRNEFKVYLILDEAYQSGRLHDRIAPRCYGAFEGRYMDVLVLDFCNSILNSWDDLSASGRSNVYKLVQDLHSIGIVHEDLEPRNIVRTHGGGFLLIDFSESKMHVCKESKVGVPDTHLAPGQDQKCSELQTLRRLLWKRQPLQSKRVNFR